MYLSNKDIHEHRLHMKMLNTLSDLVWSFPRNSINVYYWSYAVLFLKVFQMKKRIIKVNRVAAQGQTDILWIFSLEVF